MPLLNLTKKETKPNSESTLTLIKGIEDEGYRTFKGPYWDKGYPTFVSLEPSNNSLITRVLGQWHWLLACKIEPVIGKTNDLSLQQYLPNANNVVIQDRRTLFSVIPGKVDISISTVVLEAILELKLLDHLENVSPKGYFRVTDMGLLHTVVPYRPKVLRDTLTSKWLKKSKDIDAECYYCNKLSTIISLLSENKISAANALLVVSELWGV